MAFFSGLLSITLLVWLISRLLKKGPFQTFWAAARIAAVIMFIQVGIMHLLKPESFTYMIEGLLPMPKTLIIVSGITEILLGIGLLWSKTRKWAAWLLIVQLIAMFPANINVALNQLPAPGGLPSSPWYVWSRLIFQPIYIYWIYKSALEPRKLNIKATALASLSILFFAFQPVKESSKCVVNITNLPSAGGDLYIGWYNHEDGFREVSRSVYSQILPTNATTTVSIDFENIKNGTYAISVFLDQNKNGILDKNFFGIPTEPYGFSNNVIPAMRASSFQEASFDIQEDKAITIKLKN